MTDQPMHPATQPTNRSVLRSRSHQVLCLVVAATCGVLAATNLAVVAGSGRPVPSAVAAVVLVALGLLAVRYAYACVVVDHAARTLIVRNPLRTYVLGPDEIDTIELRASRVPNTYRRNRRLLVVRRRTGRPITMIGGCAVGTAAVAQMREDVLAVLYA